MRDTIKPTIIHNEKNFPLPFSSKTARLIELKNFHEQFNQIGMHSLRSICPVSFISFRSAHSLETSEKRGGGGIPLKAYTLAASCYYSEKYLFNCLSFYLTKLIMNLIITDKI
jgi:hypothetical protein